MSRDVPELLLQNARSAIEAAQEVIGQCDCTMHEMPDQDPKRRWREARDAYYTSGENMPVTMERGAFRWAHGITFRRLNDAGDVELTFGGIYFKVPAAEWCSILAAVTKRGDDAISYAAARELHE